MGSSRMISLLSLASLDSFAYPHSYSQRDANQDREFGLEESGAWSKINKVQKTRLGQRIWQLLPSSMVPLQTEKECQTSQIKLIRMRRYRENAIRLSSRMITIKSIDTRSRRIRIRRRGLREEKKRREEEDREIKKRREHFILLIFHIIIAANFHGPHLYIRPNLWEDNFFTRT